MQWGTSQFPEILQAVEVPFMTNAECQVIYANQTILPIHIWWVLRTDKLSAPIWESVE